MHKLNLAKVEAEINDALSLPMERRISNIVLIMDELLQLWKDDDKSVALLALIKAIHRVDPAHPAKAKYFSKCMHGSVSHARGKTNLIHVPEWRAKFHRDRDEEIHYEFSSDLFQIPVTDYTYELLDILDSIPRDDTDRAIIWELINGSTETEIAGKLRISQPTVNLRRKRIRKELCSSYIG